MPGPLDASKLPTQEEMERKRTLDLTQGFASGRTPEAAAEALRYARETGVPYGQAEVTLKGVLRRTPSWDSLVREAPVLAERLSDPGRAAAMQDDVEKLHGVEKLIGGWDEMGWEAKNASIRGNIIRKLANIGWRQVTGDATPEDLAEATKLEAEMQAYPERELGFFPGVLPAAAESLPLMVQNIARSGGYAGAGAGVGAAAGSVIPGAGTLVGAKIGAAVGFKVGTGIESGKAEAGLAMQEFLKIPGVNESAARGAALGVGAVNGALEAVALDVILKKVPGVAALVKARGAKAFFTKALRSESGRRVLGGLSKRIAQVGVTEALTEALQELSNVVGGTAVTPEVVGFQDAVARVWAERGRIGEAGKKGFQAGLGFAGMEIGGGIVTDVQGARKALQRKTMFEELAVLGKDSKTRERLPEEYRAFVERIQEKYGAQEAVTVPKEKLFQLLEEEGFTEDDIREKLPGVAAQAAQAGPEDEITILLPDFATHVAPLDGFAKLSEDLRVGDEPTPREAVEIEKRAKEVLKEMQSAEKRDGTVSDDSRKVFDDVMSMLSFTDENVARRFATMWTAFAESRASRKGTNVFEEYKSFGLTVSNSDLVEALIPEETIETLTPEQVALREQARQGDEAAFDALVETLQTDELTGANTQSAWKVFAAKNRPGWYVTIDANDLKRVNDTLGGHEAGDAFLKAIAQAAAPAIRGNKGKFFRSGGDEFTAHFLDRAQADTAVQALTKAINEMPALFEGKHKASISLGAGPTFAQADKAAGKAKERAKAAGRSGFRENPNAQPDLAQGDVFAEVDDTPALAPVQELHQDVDEDHAPLWFFQSSRNVAEAKQEKGDAKSWMSIISKGTKKEEMEFLGIEEWLGKQGKLITKAQVMEFLEAHDLPVEEQVLTQGGPVLSDERIDEIQDRLGNFGVTIQDDGTFEMVVSDTEEDRSSDIDEILDTAHNVSGILTRQDKGRIKLLIEDARDYVGEEDAFDRNSHIAEQIKAIFGEHNGLDIEVEEDGTLTFDGYITREVEKTLDDKSDIVDHIKEYYGRNDARVAEELMEEYENGQNSNADGDGETEYRNYTLKKLGADAVEGTYKELLFYAPGFDSRKFESAHWPGTGLEKGLIAHARFAVHEFGGKKVFVIEEIQSDLHQAARNAVQSATSQIKEMYRKLLGLNGTQMRGLKVADLEKMAAEQGKTFPQPKDVERINILKARTGYVTQEEITDRLKATYNAGAQRAEFEDPMTGRKMSFRPQSTGNPEKVLMPEPLLRTRAGKIIFEEIVGADESVPDAPLKTTWDEFVAKRLLMWAAAEGFDTIVWPTGEIQAARYDLAQAVEKLSWRRGVLVNGREFESVAQARLILSEDIFALRFQPGMNSAGDAATQARSEADADIANGTPIYFVTAYDHHGSQIRSNELDAGFTEEKLRGAFGNALAQRMIESENESDTIAGPDLSIGGEGMAFAYDKKLPSFVEKQIKKFGGKVEKVPHPALTKTVSKTVLKGGQDPVKFAADLRSKLQKRFDAVEQYTIDAKDLSERVHAVAPDFVGSKGARVGWRQEPQSVGDLQSRIGDLEEGIKAAQAEIDTIPKMVALAEKYDGDVDEFTARGGYFPEAIFKAFDAAKELKKQIQAGERIYARLATSEAYRLQRHEDEAKYRGREISDAEKAELDSELAAEAAHTKQKLGEKKAALRELTDSLDITSAAWWREEVEPLYVKEIQKRKDLIEEIEKLAKMRADLGISSGDFRDVNATVAKLEKAEGWLKDVASGSINDPMFGINRAIRFGGEYSTYGRQGIEEYEISAFNTITGIDISGEIETVTEKDETLVWKADFPAELREQIRTKGLPLFQRGASEKQGENYRGAIEFDDTRRWFKITLTGSANLSTFLHESGHAFLEILRRDALAGHAQSAADLATVERWMAAGGGDRTAQLERFARGFEAYLMEGKAPSTRLVEVFTAFKEWLKFVYSSLTGLKVNLTDEVREVMDRLLATDIEIENAQRATGLVPSLGPTELSPVELQAFQERWSAAVKAKQDEMERDAMVALRRAVKDAQTTIRNEVEQEAKTSSPHSKAWNAAEFLRTGKTLDGTEIAPQAGRKLSKKTIREYVEEGDRRFIKLGKMIADDGMDADALAPFLGFADGQELVTALLDAPSRAGWIREQTDARMADKYPNSTLASLAEKAVEKLHSPEIDTLLELELDAFDRKAGRAPAPRARDVLRLAARRRAEEMTSQEMQPGVHLRAEERAAREVLEAVAKKDYNTARDARRRQMWHRFMYREVTKAREEVGKIRDYLHEFETLPVQKRIGKAGERYNESIAAILEGIDLSRASNTALARRASLEKYLQEMEAEGEPVAIPPELRAELGLKSWKQMSLSELRAVRDAVANIESLAMLKNKLFDGRKRRDFVITTTKLAEHIRSNVGVNFENGIGEPGWWEGKKEYLRKARANMSKIEFICRVLDGGKTAGWAHELIFQPLRDAQARKAKMTKEITEALLKPLQEMSLQDRLRFDRTVDFLGHKLRYREVIAFILNLGNAGNKEKLLKGFGMSEEAVQAALDEMYAKGIIKDSDLDLVQHVWDTIDKLWPEIRSLSQRNIGVAPPKVESMPLAIGGKALRGGYYPVVYNRRLSHKAEQIAQRKTGDLFENNFLLPAVEKGFTESRTKFFAPVSLSLDVIPTHINEVIHYITHYEAVRAVDKLTSSKAVKEAITEGLGREVYGLIRPWLQAIAADGNVHESTKWYDSLLRRLRLGSSIALLGFKVTTGLKQILGLTSTIKEIGPYTLTGARALLANVFTGKGFGEITSLSSEFANIDSQMDRDIGAMFRKLEGTFSVYGQAKDKIAHFALAWMMLNQKAVNAVTWYGAREKAMREGHEDPVRYADAVVSMSQSGGGIKDLAAIQRGSEMEKTMTVMYTYFSVLFNQITEAMPGKKTGQKVAILAARWWWLVTLPALLDAAMSAGIPDDDEDKERYLEAMTYGQILYFGRSIPLVGQAAESFIGERQARYGAWIETLLRGASSSKDVLTGDATASDVKNVVDLLGAATGLPASAAKNAFMFADEYLSGRMDEPIQNFLFRSPSEFK